MKKSSLNILEKLLIKRQTPGLCMKNLNFFLSSSNNLQYSLIFFSINHLILNSVFFHLIFPMVAADFLYFCALFLDRSLSPTNNICFSYVKIFICSCLQFMIIILHLLWKFWDILHSCVSHMCLFWYWSKKNINFCKDSFFLACI